MIMTKMLCSALSSPAPSALCILRVGLTRAVWLALILYGALLIQGCAMVKLKEGHATSYVESKRGDALTTQRLSASARQVLATIGMDERACITKALECSSAIVGEELISEGEGLASAAEINLLASLRRGKGGADAGDLSLLLQSARYAYAYNFYSQDRLSDTSSDERDIQVRDYYNFAVEKIASFAMRDMVGNGELRSSIRAPSPWILELQMDPKWPRPVLLPQALYSASMVNFKGIRNQYRRSGFGGEMVALMPDQTVDLNTSTEPAPVEPGYMSLMRAPDVTFILKFEGESVEQILGTHQATLSALDPLLHDHVSIGKRNVPLAANYTAGYGVWLGTSGFAEHALRALFGMTGAIDRPHLFLMQPYDPNRRVLLLIHGLASSPEAWVNLGNDILGDKILRQHFQVWLMYYPTNLPIVYNHMAIRSTVQSAVQILDPDDSDPASRDMVLIGHSMGGVISRLMVSSTQGDALWLKLGFGDLPNDADGDGVRKELTPLFHFEPMKQIGAAVFVAAPHRGTPKAHGTLASLVRRFSGVPLRIIQRFKYTAKIATTAPGKLPISIDDLSDADPTTRALANLPIKPGLPYHSVIARKELDGELSISSDGFVPYSSSHLQGAQSEVIIHGGHSVQESAQAIVELRRILRRIAGDEPKRIPDAEHAREIN